MLGGIRPTSCGRLWEMCKRSGRAVGFWPKCRNGNIEGIYKSREIMESLLLFSSRRPLSLGETSKSGEILERTFAEEGALKDGYREN